MVQAITILLKLFSPTQLILFTLTRSFVSGFSVAAADVLALLAVYAERFYEWVQLSLKNIKCKYLNLLMLE